MSDARWLLEHVDGAVIGAADDPDLPQATLAIRTDGVPVVLLGPGPAISDDSWRRIRAALHDHRAGRAAGHDWHTRATGSYLFFDSMERLVPAVRDLDLSWPQGA